MKFGKEFKQFLLRGNVVDLAIAFIMGAAFASVVTALVADLLTPLIAAIGAEPSFQDFSFTFRGAIFKYGHFVNALISFVLLAALLFFLVVKPINRLVSRSHQQPPPDPTVRKCPQCLSDIPVGARRCRFCTAEVDAA